MNRHLLLIVNPAAGKRRGAAVAAQIAALYREAGWQCDVRETQGAGDAQRFVLHEGADKAMILCVGGDGTLSETLSGLLSLTPQPPLCYAPLGSTNDLAASVGLPRDPLAAAQCGLTGAPRLIDAGRFNGHIFSYVACFGVFSRTSYLTSRHMKNRLGHFAYVLTGAFELNHIRPYHVRVECESDVIEGDFLFGAVCNTRTLGGALRLPVDQSTLCDGRHELLMVREPRSLWAAFSLLWHLACGHYEHPLLEYRHISRATFHMPGEMPWSLDGERADAGERVSFCTLPSAYRLMLPK